MRLVRVIRNAIGGSFVLSLLLLGWDELQWRRIERRARRRLRLG